MPQNLLGGKVMKSLASGARLPGSRLAHGSPMCHLGPSRPLSVTWLGLPPVQRESREPASGLVVRGEVMNAQCISPWMVGASKVSVKWEGAGGHPRRGGELRNVHSQWCVECRRPLSVL